MKRASRRSERVAELIREAVAVHLQTAKDPRIGFVTVTGADVTRDLAVATIYVSIMGDESEQERTLEGLDHARGHLRTELARELRLKQTPELRFTLDRGLAYARRIDAILSDLKRREGDA